ncbi:DUF397 domain-containing protein [Streptomyces sp. SID4919]|uniref:DUF397 domain-containing protein n=1 Tax=unclassified Streptomyces TaxID=2593676 RepID=UPI0008237A8F|nr:DUF397 domain-containing protein [Streptomyces sp. AmelKG-E11A]MYY10076.1 DUF397 domain-containing protein [Streptomyces sp. SID4919]SCK50312.1 protein of unknown function [Streptomyces sp. AmelKG-E11A]
MPENPSWQKSSFSGAQGPECLEVAANEAGLHIRESDAPAVIVTTDRAKLAAFVAGVKAGEFDHLLG